MGLLKLYLDYWYFKGPVLKIDFFPDIEGKELYRKTQMMGEIFIINKGNMNTTIYFRLLDIKGNYKNLELKLKDSENNHYFSDNIIKIKNNSSYGLIYEIKNKKFTSKLYKNIYFEIIGPGVDKRFFNRGGKIKRNFSLIFE